MRRFHTTNTARVTLAALSLALLAPQSALAVAVAIDPVRDAYPAGDTFLIPVRIRADDTCINAVAISLTFDPAVARVVDVARGDSIITLWSEEPRVDNDEGRVYFSGGIPGGYCGRIAGDPGLTNKLADLVVSTAGVGGRGVATTTALSFAFSRETQVLAHDGRGTPLPASLHGATVTLVPATTTPKNAWLAKVRSDERAPELFTIELVREEGIAGGKHAIVFHTTDKQSGIDHYEVLETDPDRFGLLSWIGKKAHWIEAQSPYVLRDQKLNSVIMVKAVDKAGNERIARYEPPQSLLTRVEELYPFVLIGVAAFLLFLLFDYMRRRRALRRAPRASSFEAPRATRSPDDAHDEADEKHQS